jgi:putative peptidoglycan lipid II flippase
VPALPPARAGGSRSGAVPASRGDDDLFPPSDEPAEDHEPPRSARRRLAVVGLPLLALALVVGGGWWFGSNVLSVAGSVSEQHGSTPSPTVTRSAAPTPSATPSPTATTPAAPTAAGVALPIASAAVFNPYGDGEPENNRQVRLSYDGDPTTAWKTLDYRSTPVFGGLKPGVGVLYDLGSPRALSGITLTTTRPGSAVEVRVGTDPSGGLDSYRVVASSAPLQARTDLSVTAPAPARYVLVWVTSLAPAGGRYAADLAEVAFTGT